MSCCYGLVFERAPHRDADPGGGPSAPLRPARDAAHHPGARGIPALHPRRHGRLRRDAAGAVGNCRDSRLSTTPHSASARCWARGSSSAAWLIRVAPAMLRTLDYGWTNTLLALPCVFSACRRRFCSGGAARGEGRAPKSMQWYRKVDNRLRENSRSHRRSD